LGGDMSHDYDRTRTAAKVTTLLVAFQMFLKEVSAGLNSALMRPAKIKWGAKSLVSGYIVVETGGRVYSFACKIDSAGRLAVTLAKEFNFSFGETEQAKSIGSKLAKIITG